MTMTEEIEKVEALDIPKGKLVLVHCYICENTQRFPILNIIESYPITLMINAMTANGLKPQQIPAYLCKQHYDGVLTNGEANTGVVLK